MFEVLRKWPSFSRSAADLSFIVPKPYLSVDAEWSPRNDKPTIIGVSNGEWGVSCGWEEGKPYLIELLEKYPQADVLMHNGISADIPVLAKEGIRIPIERVQDSILMHWLTNMSLSKGAKKDDDEGERKGRGWNNLYAACSFYLSVPRWKDCVDEEQCRLAHRPCPEHDPWQYNYNDCHWIAQAYPLMLKRAKMLGVDKLYPLHRDVAVVLEKMRARGVLVDIPYVETLRGEFASACREYWDDDAGTGIFPFNPNSPQQVVKYFKSKGILLDNAQEETIRDAEEDHDDPELTNLLDYKELGKGPDRWFAPRTFDYQRNEWQGYVGSDGFIHCSLSFFTSTGRLTCSNPNLQNVSKRRRDRATGESIGKKVRRAIVAPEGYYLYRADLKNAENRVYMHLAGYRDIPNIDFHAMMRDMIGIKEDDPFAIQMGNAREAAKTVTHATDYGEGVKLVTVEELRKPRMQAEIKAGVRVAFSEWRVWGKVVTFTGINLAKRAFGSATWENRKRALSVAMKYFETFPKLRQLQMDITKQVERERCVRPPTGYVLSSYGYEEERIKTALAMFGSNPVAHIMKYILLNAENHPRLSPTLSIHDEVLFAVSREYKPKEVEKWIREVTEISVPEIPRFVIPSDCTFGLNWTDQTGISDS